MPVSPLAMSAGVFTGTEMPPGNVNVNENDVVNVKVGDTVRKGQVVCIVEAMKLMNEIEAEAEGKVVEILARNGEHVEYGQSLLRLAKS